MLKKKFRSDAVAASNLTPSQPSPQLHRPKKQKLLDSFPLRAPSPDGEEEKESPSQDEPTEPIKDESPAPEVASLTEESTGAVGGEVTSEVEEPKDVFSEMESISGSSLLSEIQNQMAELVERAQDPEEDTKMSPDEPSLSEERDFVGGHMDSPEKETEMASIEEKQEAPLEEDTPAPPPVQEVPAAPPVQEVPTPPPVQEVPAEKPSTPPAVPEPVQEFITPESQKVGTNFMSHSDCFEPTYKWCVCSDAWL